MPELKNRRAHIGVSVSDTDTGRNIEVSIHLKHRIPFISMSQTDGTGTAKVESSDVAALEYNKAFASAVTDTGAVGALTNVLVDPNNIARFTTVAVIGSLLTQDESMLVHDSKYGDLILVPTLLCMGDGATTDLLADSSIPIDGYQVGGSVRQYTQSLYQEVEANLNIPVPGAELPTKTHLFTITGFREVGGVIKNSGITLGSKYLESDLISCLQMTSIGGTVALGGEVKSARLVKSSNNSYALLPMKAGALADILVVSQL